MPYMRWFWSVVYVALCLVPQCCSAADNLPLLLRLAPCSASDSHQRWNLSASFLNTGSSLCVTNDTERPGDVVGLTACETTTASFSFKPSGQIALTGTALCLDQGPLKLSGRSFQYVPCDTSSRTQHFMFNSSTGLISSSSTEGFCMQADAFNLPRLPVHPGGVISAGYGDMNVQFHFAHSAGLAGNCAHDSQPFHCAAQRFPGDALVPQTPESSVPHCDGCPDGYTVLYDHCKNHPEAIRVRFELRVRSIFRHQRIYHKCV